MSTSLMTTRRFAPLFWCQFFAAFGDNFLKTSLVFVILFQVAGADFEALITLAGATLIAPFFFLSGLGGELADRYDKALVAQRLKLAEIAVAAIAVAGFAFHSLTLLFFAVFLFGTIASLFGPIKYGILPDHLARTELTTGNALVEGGTFLAILLGTIVAGIAAKGGGDPIHFAWLMMVTALASWGASLLIPSTGEGAPQLTVNRNIAASTIGLVKYVWAEPRLWWGAMVVSWFWLVGAIVLSLLPPLVTFRIGGTEGVVTLFLTIFSVAVAVGSGLAAWLAAGRIVLLPTLCGAVLLGLFSLDLGWTASAIAGAAHPIGIGEYFASPYSIHLAIDLAGLAIAGGLFIVPTFAAVQAWAGADHRARVIAAVNVLNAAFMVVGALLIALLQKLGWSVATLFALIGLANLVVAVVIGFTMPTSWMNDLLSIVFRAFFRLEVTGLENVAKAGDNAIIALNHVSFLDPPLAMALLAQAAGLRHRRRDVEAMVDPAVPQVRAHDGARSAQADGAAHHHQRRTRRQHAGDLPRRPHHHHRQPDEDLRRRRDDRRQVGRHGGAGAHRRAGGDDLQPAQEYAGAPPPVPEDHGDAARTGEAFRRSGVQGTQAPPGRGRRALRRDVEPHVSHHADRPHRRRSDHQGGGDPRRQMAHHRGSAQRQPDLQAAAAGNRDPRRQADAAGARGPRGGRHAADLERRRGHAAGADVGRPRSGDAQLHLGSRQHPRRLPRRGDRHRRHRARLRREGAAGEAHRPDRAARAHRLPGRCAQDGELWRQAARGAAGEKAAGRAQAG